jgi:hypothetical protein
MAEVYSGGRRNSKRGCGWEFKSDQPGPLKENHTAEGNGLTAKWDRLTSTAVIQRNKDSEREADSERMSNGGNTLD